MVTTKRGSSLLSPFFIGLVYLLEMKNIIKEEIFRIRELMNIHTTFLYESIILNEQPTPKRIMDGMEKWFSSLSGSKLSSVEKSLENNVRKYNIRVDPKILKNLEGDTKRIKELSEKFKQILELPNRNSSFLMDRNLQIKVLSELDPKFADDFVNVDYNSFESIVNYQIKQLVDETGIEKTKAIEQVLTPKVENISTDLGES